VLLKVDDGDVTGSDRSVELFGLGRGGLRS